MIPTVALIVERRHGEDIAIIISVVMVIVVVVEIGATTDIVDPDPIETSGNDIRRVDIEIVMMSVDRHDGAIEVILDIVIRRRMITDAVPWSGMGIIMIAIGIGTTDVVDMTTTMRMNMIVADRWVAADGLKQILTIVIPLTYPSPKVK